MPMIQDPDPYPHHPFGGCDICNKMRPLSQAWAPGGVETWACDECLDREPDEDEGCEPDGFDTWPDNLPLQGGHQ